MMGEPVTTGMMIGAAGGALMNRKNPIQGAMLGGAMGAAGGSFYGGAASATGAGAPGIGANAMIPGVQGGAGALAGETTALTATSPTFGQTIGAGFKGLGQDISAANKWMNQNPMTSQIGLKLAQEAMQPPPQIPMPGGVPINRGQVQSADYMSLLNPQQQTVIRPATPSLI